MSLTENKKDTLQGYLYCMWNKMFSTYGEDVYKLGRTSCLEGRLNNYVTSYIEPCEYKYTTNRVFQNSIYAERVMFFLLRRFRIKKNREFFRVDLETVIETMKKLEVMADEKIEKIYKKILQDFCNERIMENIENDSHYLDCMVSPDSFFSQFMFRPKNPAMYYKFGYVEPEKNDWYVLNYKIIYDDKETSL
jgi:hypothetical protein